MSKSHSNLIQAHEWQAEAIAKNHSLATQAEKEGRQADARLYRALAQGQQVHVDKAHMILSDTQPETHELQGNTPLTLAQTASEFKKMVMVAATERESVLEATFIQFMKTAQSHLAVAEPNDAPPSSYHVCQICGFIAPGAPPERCPVCRAVAQQFTAIE
ncbi:hypothetical protein OAN24_04280 [Pseudodesulfovibrio sp.]|nr:hypothetical protein [Pseudodesulfovibrio sp.]